MGHRRQPGDRFAASGYVDRGPGLNMVDEFAQMCFCIREIDRVDATFLTNKIVI